MTPSRNGRAVVLGADVDGLAAAVTLAAADRAVVVIDPRPAAGGLAAATEFHPGYTAPGLLHDAHLLRRELLAPLGLERHGMVWRSDEPGFFVTGLEEGEPGWLQRTGGTEDGSAQADWRRFVDAVAPVVRDLVDQPPPEALSPGVADLAGLARRALKVRALGERDMLELLRLVPTTANDWVTESFPPEEVAQALARVAPALQGTVLGPLAPGTSGLVLLRECCAGPEPAGGFPALTEALLFRARAAGVEVRLDTPAAGITVGADGVEGVELASGERLEAGLVLSSLDPRTTLVDLLPPGHLSPLTEKAALDWRTRGGTAALFVALSARPRFTGADRVPERAVVAGSLLHLERVADGLKYDLPPEEPWLDLRVFAGEGAAPSGAATLSILLHGVPRDPPGGWKARPRNKLVKRALDALEAVAPGTKKTVEAHELLLPADIEARYHQTGGHLFAGELALDQLWLQRPSLALSRYATPVAGLFLCGPGSHPGGPFAGGAGVLGARAALSA